MKYENVCIETIGYHLPENVVTSDDIERELAPLYEKLKLPEGRLQLMSGIHERRFWDKGVFPSEVSSIAAKNALAKTSIHKNDIGTLICASVCRDFLEPATATVVHHNLELPPGCMVYDISNACLGVMNAMITVANQIETGQIKAGLIVSGENGGPLVRATIESLLSDPEPSRAKIKKAFASLTIGSAAVAVLLVHRDLSANRHRLLGGVARADTRHNHLCRGTEDTGMGLSAQPLMETDAEVLMQEGIRLGSETWEIFKKEMSWSNKDIDRSFCHQVGSLHRKLMLETFQLDPAKDFTTLETLGNTGSAALPVTLAKGDEAGVLSSGDKAALLGIGSGLNCMMLGVEW